jgi:FMN phosphatase YigB (HAD superfamily)
MIKVVLFDNDGVLFRWMIPQIEVWKLAKDLQAKGIKTGILSNVDRIGAQIFKLLRGYRGYDVVFLSYRHGVKKPQDKFYELAVDHFKVKPDEILFIDDRKHWLAPADKLGMKTIHSRSTSQIIREIKQLIKQENGIKL